MSLITTAQVEDLIEKRQKLYNETRLLTNAISSLQSICEHDWVANGYDSHKDHYKCSLCLKEDSW